MSVINCPNQNELVYFNMNNPSLVLNIFEQEDGVLVAVHSGTDNSPSIEALVSEGGAITPMEVLTRLTSGEVLTVDSIFVGQKADENYDEDEAGEEVDEEVDNDW